MCSVSEERQRARLHRRDVRSDKPPRVSPREFSCVRAESNPVAARCSPAILASVGFNTEVRKALDADTALHRRFGTLRSAVQRFSPNGFNATFRNLEQAVGVSDPDNWTEEEIVQAAELLR